MAIHTPPDVACFFLGSAYETNTHRAGAWAGWGWGVGEAITMGENVTTGGPANVSGQRRKVVVDVYLLLASDGCILLSKRANTGYGDGAYEPPSGQLADRETIVETAIRIAATTGILVSAEKVTLAHVMHDVSGGGRIAFFLATSGWQGEPEVREDVRWFPLDELPTNMLDRAKVALRHYVDGMRFSTYPAFAPPAHMAS
jgi:8-oxo-dGTP diphosphatase